MTDRYVMDVGAHAGTDTAEYLRQGHRVVAIEANPVLARRLEQQFAAEIATGQLTVVGAGVHHVAGSMDFFVSDNDLLSSFIEERATAGGEKAERVKVPTVPFGDLLDQHGVPDYLKIDIEGLDSVCIDALEPGRLPPYLSTEIDWSGPLTVRRLQALGYRRFKLIAQESHRAVTPRRLLTRFAGAPPQSAQHHTSGPFGDDADGRWLSPRTAFLTVSMLVTRRAWQQGALWHDLHATTAS